MAPYAAVVLSAHILLSQLWTANAWNIPFPLPTPAPHLLQQNATDIGKRANIQTDMSTCGYLDGDPKKPRTANSGYNCRVDTLNGLWGFCPTTVITASDCGLAGNCIDSFSCSNGCGNPNTKLTTFTCEPKQYCSFAVLTFGVDQTYSYIGCGGSPKTDHYFPSPTAQAAPTTKKDDPKTSEQASTSIPTQTVAPGSTQPSSTSTPGSTTSSTTQSSRASIETDLAPAKTTSSNNGGGTGSSGTNSSGSQTDSSPNNIGAIIGGVIGGIALLCVFGIAAIYLLRRNRSNRSNRSRSPQISAPLGTDVPVETKDYKYNQRYTGGWGPRELQGSQYERRPDQPVELPS